MESLPVPPKHPLLAHGPLYAFSLPPELLQTISLRSPLGGHSAAGPEGSSNSKGRKLDGEKANDTNGEAESSSALGCNLCQVKRFESISEQRSHFSSDWHRYNVKRKMANKTSVGENEWEGMVEALSDSLTGSASSSSEDYSSSEDDETTVARVLAKQKLSTNGQQADTEEEPDFTSPRSPLLWYESPSVVQDTQFGVYRAIFPAATRKAATEIAWLDELRKLQVVEDTTRLGKRSAMKADSHPTDPSSRIWTLLATGGGHFAGAVISLVPRLNNRGNGRIEKEVVVLASKTFHRYTTRRKQGGAQSTNDNAKGNAKSVGAQLRRANEAALIDDIRGLLLSWKEMIDKSEVVFLRASKTAHRVFYDYEDAVLQKRDPRIRGFPFPTRRPTQAELVRCFTELTRVKLSHLTAEELQQLDEAYRQAMAPKKPPPAAVKPDQPKAPEVPKLSEEEIVERDRWERVVDMARRGRLDALKGFLEKQSTEGSGGEAKRWLGNLPEWMEERRASPTLLHVAASNDQPDLVRWLLVEQRVDPTLQAFASSPTAPTENGEQALTSSTLPPRTAYECASSRGVRNVFRRAYADHPDWYDWEGSVRVPSQLTEEMETTQNSKKTERKSNLKQKMRERAAERDAERQIEEEKERIVREAAEKKKELERMNTPSKGPTRLGGAAPRAVLEQTQLKGLSEEQKMRIERERRAKAAEARMAAR